MTATVVIDWTESAKSPGIPTVAMVKHSQSRRRTGMQPAVEVVLAGDSASLQHGRLWRHVVFVASKRARRLVISQSEASPQQAESLAAGVR